MSADTAGIVISEEEIAHGIALLGDVTQLPERRYGDVPIDHVCGWPIAEGKCGERIDRVCFLSDREEKIDVVGFCDHHADCMTAAWQRSKADAQRLSENEIDELYEKQKQDELLNTKGLR